MRAVIKAEEPAVIIPFILSTALYIFIICGLFFYLQATERLVKKYTSKKDDFLEIALVKRTDVIKKVDPNVEIKKVPEKVETPTPPAPAEVEEKKSEPKTAKKENVSVKDLFGKVKIKKKKVKKIPTSKKEQIKASRLKPKKNKKVTTKKKIKITTSLKFASMPTMASASSTGEYDKFRGEVTEQLQAYWQQTGVNMTEANAEVEINIDKNGNFSYMIVKESYNSEFNARLREFLEQMRETQFPKNPKNLSFPNVNFKDKLEWRN